jgi:hypothetical protein
MEKLIKTTKTIAQDWENLLWSTGGKLELPKCFFYDCTWKFHDNGIPFMSDPANTAKINIKQSQPQSQSHPIIMEIQQKPVDQGHRTLGVHITPDGSTTMEETHLTQKNKTMLNRMRAARHITRDEALRAYQSIYIPAITYGLPATNLSKSFLDKIQSQALQTFLPRIGLNKHHPRSSLFAPTTIGGLGMINMYTEQGAQHIMQAIRHLRNSASELHRPLKIAYAWYHRLAGTEKPPWENPTLPLPHVPQIWLHTVTQHLKDQNLTIITKHQQPIMVRRQNDCVLMDKVLQNPRFSNHEIKLFNLCRLYLKVECLSDLCTAEGKEISTSVMNTTDPYDQRNP